MNFNRFHFLISLVLRKCCSGFKTVQIFKRMFFSSFAFPVFLTVFRKHMETQLISMILNLYFFLGSDFPKISKINLSHVCSETADTHLFCFTSAVKMLTFSFVRRVSGVERFLDYRIEIVAPIHTPLRFLKKSCCGPRAVNTFVSSVLFIFIKHHSRLYAVKNSIIAKIPTKR